MYNIPKHTWEPKHQKVDIYYSMRESIVHFFTSVNFKRTRHSRNITFEITDSKESKVEFIFYFKYFCDWITCQKNICNFLHEHTNFRIIIYVNQIKPCTRLFVMVEWLVTFLVPLNILSAQDSIGCTLQKYWVFQITVDALKITSAKMLYKVY